MKTDIQIATEAKMLPIKEVATTLGVTDDELELYGKYKAKINDDFLTRMKDKHYFLLRMDFVCLE